MKKKSQLNFQIIKKLFAGKKQYATPALLIVVSIFIFFFALIPQFNDLLTTISQRNDALLKLKVLRNNLTTLTNTDENALSLNLQTSLKALPQNKDFESVLNAMSSSAAKAGTSIANFEFKVGDLSKSQISNGQFPALTITLSINDGAVVTTRFMTSLASSLPLSEVKSLDVNGNYSNITLLFYYKSASTLKASFDTPIVPLSAKQTQLLSQLSSWDSGKIFLPAVSSSSSSASTPF